MVAYLTVGFIVVFTILTFPQDEFKVEFTRDTLVTTTSETANRPIQGWTSGFT